MDIIDKIQFWAKNEIFIEYITIDQIVNGYGEQVEKGNMPPVTFTVNVIKDGEYLHEMSFDDLREALEDGHKFALAYAKEHFPDMVTPYGGKRTRMIDLEVGTKFHVCNGYWNGEVIMKDGAKCILIQGDSLQNAFVIEDNYILDIEMLDKEQKGRE